ncbi:MAG: MobP3 family relaxase [Oscillospiraceae bacterium]|nr:MobP3 family relaxase [Oscillospiraceae bacterium]
MPKIIFTSHYMRDAPSAQLANYVKYIGTREGVEKIDESKLELPATINQKNLIKQLIRDIPSARDMLEYNDYCLQSTIGNATEFISLALEQNINLIGKRENYVDYIANRPRVERIGEHGLFTDAGTPVVLSQVQDDVVNHKGAVWTHVISLRREDAARLGYDSGKQWQDLIRSKKAMLSKYMKIDSENLRWYCAFHNESHHPHVHLMVYSAKDNDGFLTEPAIEAMRSEFAHDIFRQDFANIYEQQNKVRTSLKHGSATVMEELIRQIALGTCENRVIEEKMLLLSQRLQNTGSKKVYGYLKADVKAIIDQIVDELAKEEEVAKLYTAWGDRQDEILKTYTNKTVSLPPLSQQKQFKSIKNMVITEALKIGSHLFTFEDEIAPEPVPSDEITPHDYEAMLDDADFYEPQETTDVIYHVGWSDQYKMARQYLYGSKTIEQNFEEAYKLFLLEAETGNALAMHDLGRMFADGLGREIDPNAAYEWYKKALNAFLSAEAEKPKSYIPYRIGKMFAAGLGTEQSYEQAASWFSQAVKKNHKYAEYSLGGLYYRGQGVEQSYETALELYVRSAKQGNPYADYELAKMYRDGIGTQKNTEEADRYFKSAFVGFSSLEAESHDDKLQYRIGQMLYTGTGIKKDIPAAIPYLEKSAKLGNVNAQYLLGKLWLETGIGNSMQALAWIEKAADGGNTSAQYALAKLYCEGIHLDKNMQKALELFTLSAEQKNEYAAYQLGKLYLRNEEIPKDVEAAIRWLTASAEQGNQFAQYVLGKLYFFDGDVPRDKEKSLYWLTASAAQGNIYAQFLIDHINEYRSPSVLLAATRLMHRLESLFREDNRKANGVNVFHIDRKRRRKLQEKKQAGGHARDDHEQQQHQLTL